MSATYLLNCPKNILENMVKCFTYWSTFQTHSFKVKVTDQSRTIEFLSAPNLCNTLWGIHESLVKCLSHQCIYILNHLKDIHETYVSYLIHWEHTQNPHFRSTTNRSRLEFKVEDISQRISLKNCQNLVQMFISLR